MSIRKDKNNDYIVDISAGINLKTGKRKRIVRRGIKTYKEAKEVLNEITNLENQVIDVTDNPSITKVIEDYLEHSRMYDKPSTYEKKCNIFRNHISKYFKKFRIRDVTKKEVAEFRNLLAEHDISNNYKRYILTALKTFFNYCMKQELIYKNPAITVDNFKKEKITMKFWTINEFKNFIENVDDKIYYTFFYLMYFTGIRRGEALALTWEDIDFYSSKLHITKTCTHVHKQGYVITKPKTSESNRIIHLNNKLLSVLEEYKLHVVSEGLNLHDTRLFRVNDNILPKTTLDRNFNKYIEISNVKKIRVHDFRHSHVALLIHLKQDILSISKRLGHSDVSITLNNYGHLYDEADKKVANVLDRV